MGIGLSGVLTIPDGSFSGDSMMLQSVNSSAFLDDTDGGLHATANASHLGFTTIGGSTGHLGASGKPGTAHATAQSGVLC